MGERVDGVLGRLTSVERKVDSLAATMDRRFDEVAEALVEQRRYTDFAYERLEAKISQMDGRLTELDGRVVRLDAKMDSGFERMDQRFSRLDRKLDQLIDRA
jgi:predicted nuclease with TOPRIM domain